MKPKTILNGDGIHYICSKSTNITGEHQLKALKLLVDFGVNLEAENDEKFRPIHYVCSNLNNFTGEQQLKALELLVNVGVNLEAENNGESFAQFIMFVLI